MKVALGSALLLILGLISAWIARSLLVLTGEPVLVVVLILPTILYMVLSGRISELKAPGGLEAKFIRASRKSVDEKASMTAVREVIVLAKGSVNQPNALLPDIHSGKPVVLTMKLAGHYDATSLATDLNTLSAYRQFRFVVILDRKERFVGSIPIDALLRATGLYDLAGIVALINEEKEDQLEKHPLVTTQYVLAGASNIDALHEMRAECLDAIVVLDSLGRLKGMIDREEVLSDLLLEMSR